MNVTIQPGKPKGEYAVPPSKSDLHRALICAAFADAPVTLYLPSPSPLSEDILATVRCLEALGAKVYLHYDMAYYGTDIFRITKEEEGNSGRAESSCSESGMVSSILVSPAKTVPGETFLDCGESGSTLRFLLPAASTVCPCVHFTGHGRLPERPLSPLLEEMKERGFLFSAPKLPFTVFRTGAQENAAFPVYTLPGNVSSQYISGLLLAGALGNGVRIRLTSVLESAPYVKMTIRTLAAFGVTVKRSAGDEALRETGSDTGRPLITQLFEVSPAERIRSPGAYFVEGDWSNAAFVLAADLLTGGRPVLVKPGAVMESAPAESSSAKGDPAENSSAENACQDLPAADNTASPGLLIYGLTKDSPQGDKVAPDLIGAFLTGEIPDSCRGILTEEAPADRSSLPDGSALPDKKAAAFVLDAKDIPDLVPVLSTAAYLAGRPLRITGSARLRLKESDRIETTVDMLRSLGADASALPDGLVIYGSPDKPAVWTSAADRTDYRAGSAGNLCACGKADALRSADKSADCIVDAAGDHRIAMSAAVAGICGKRPVLIKGAEAAAKSYPFFFEDLEALCIHVRTAAEPSGKEE